jgi:Tol biopolymer transport system component
MSRVVGVLAALWFGGLALGVSAAPAAFPGGNGRIVFDSDRDGDPDIWTMRPNGSDPINLTAGSAAADGLASWRADGRKIAFQSDRVTATNPNGRFQIFVMNADGSDPTQITFTDLNNNDNPAWSPDGRKIVFVRHMNMVPEDPDPGVDNHDVWTMNADGSNQRNLTNNPAEDLEPSWSPDGKRLAFTSDRTGSNEVYTSSPNGSMLRQLTFTPGFDGAANWSPDSRMLVFDTERDGNGEIYTMRADGSHPVNVTRNPATELVSGWSPDGRKLAFSSNRDASDEHPDNFEVYTMRADGRRQVNRTKNPAMDFFGDWQPLRGHDRHDGADDEAHDWDDD